MQELAEGALRYSVSMRVMGGTGDALDAASLRGAPEDALTEALRACEALSEPELMESVVEEFRFTLCPGCRSQTRADPANASTVRRPARGGVQ